MDNNNYKGKAKDNAQDKKKKKKPELSQAASSLLALFNPSPSQSQSQLYQHSSDDNIQLNQLDKQEQLQIEGSPVVIPPIPPVHGPPESFTGKQPSPLSPPLSISSTSRRRINNNNSTVDMYERRGSRVHVSDIQMSLMQQQQQYAGTFQSASSTSKLVSDLSINISNHDLHNYHSDTSNDNEDDEEGVDDTKEGSVRVKTNLSLYEEDGTNRYATATYLSSHSWDPRRALELTAATRPEESTSKKHAEVGAFRGVFLPCLQNIIGVILFVRLPWITGMAGIGLSLLIILMSVLCTMLTTISMCAIASNGYVPAGGPYYMISRALGKEIGVSVGILLYISMTIGSAICVLGAVEILVNNMAPSMAFADSETHARVYGTAILLAITMISFLGMRFVSLTSIVLLLCVFIALTTIFIGLFASNRPGLPPQAVLGFPGNFTGNFMPGFDKPDLNNQINPDSVDFFILFSIFFPSVVGILAGSSRSGHLQNAAKDITRGTISAVIFSSFVYLSIVLLFGIVCTGDFLRTKIPQWGLHVAVVAWPVALVALIGCFISCLGASLQIMITAPRLIQAVAKDDIIPWLSWLKKSRKGEPHRALLVTYLIAQCAVVVGKLDSVAPITTMLYLVCFAFINFSTALLSILQYPNWRPTWRYFHWSLSLFGACLCVVYMFLIQWIFALVALTLVALMYKYIQYRGAQVQWGDGMFAMNLSVAQKNLLALERHRHVHAKNWRPQIMAFVDLDDRDQLPVDPQILHFLSQLRKSGGLTIVSSVINGDLLTNGNNIKDLGDMLTMLLKEHLIQGFAQVLVSKDVDQAKLLAIQSVGIGVLRPNTILLTYPQLQQMSPTEKRNFVQLVQTITSLNLVVILFKAITYPLNNSRQLSSTARIDVWWIMHDGGILTLLPYILKKHRIWRKAKLRIFCIAQLEDDSEEMKRDLEMLLQKFRIEAESIVVELGDYDISEFTYEKTLSMDQRKELSSNFHHAQPNNKRKRKRKELKKKAEFMNTSVKLNKLIRLHSSEAELIFCNLPSPSEQTAQDYLEYLQVLVSDLSRVVLIKGTGMEVVSTYF